MTKKRVVLRLSDDEVAVVGPVEIWEHLILIYESFAMDPDYATSADLWRNAADWIRTTLEAAQPKGKYEDDEDW